MLMPLIFRASLPFYYRHVKKFLAGAKNAQQVQRDVLFAKLRRNAQSDFGRDHGFAKIQSLEEFRRQVPVTNYDYYSDYVERVKQGEVTAMFAPAKNLFT